MRDRAFAPLLVLGLLALGTPSLAKVFVISTMQDAEDQQPGDGLCTTDLDGNPCSLRAAIQESNSLIGADVIELGGGLHRLTRTGRMEEFAASGDLDVRDDLTIVGTGEAVTRIDGEHADRIFDLQPSALSPNPTLSLSHLTVQHGRAENPDPNGGCIQVRAGTNLSLLDVSLLVCEAFDYGGALFVSGALQAQGLSAIENGWEPDQGGTLKGGAIAVVGEGASVELKDCHLADNLADSGGALFTDGSSQDPMALRTQVAIHRCSLVRNEALATGGGIHAHAGTDLTISNTTFSNNQAGGGGAIFSDGASLYELTHVTIVENQAVVGGGISEVHNHPMFTHLTQSILADNVATHSGPNCTLAIQSGGGNVLGDLVNCSIDLTPTDIVSGELGLEVLATFLPESRTEGHLPQDDSIAVDAVMSGACPEVDQRGAWRPADGDGDGIAQCDSGAVELQFSSGFRDSFESAIEWVDQ